MLFALLKSPEDMIIWLLHYAGYGTTGGVPFGHDLHLTPCRGVIRR
jgi:hypothetical protein